MPIFSTDPPKLQATSPSLIVAFISLATILLVIPFVVAFAFILRRLVNHERREKQTRTGHRLKEFKLQPVPVRKSRRANVIQQQNGLHTTNFSSSKRQNHHPSEQPRSQSNTQRRLSRPFQIPIHISALDSQESQARLCPQIDPGTTPRVSDEARVKHYVISPSSATIHLSERLPESPISPLSSASSSLSSLPYPPGPLKTVLPSPPQQSHTATHQRIQPLTRNSTRTQGGNPRGNSDQPRRRSSLFDVSQDLFINVKTKGAQRDRMDIEYFDATRGKPGTVEVETREVKVCQPTELSEMSAWCEYLSARVYVAGLEDGQSRDDKESSRKGSVGELERDEDEDKDKDEGGGSEGESEDGLNDGDWKDIQMETVDGVLAPRDWV